MQTPVQVSFRHLDFSPFIDSEVRKKAKTLEKFYSRITSVRVVVGPSEKRHQQGNLYHVRIDLKVPGKEIVVSHEQGENQAHEDIYVAIRDAFDAARRQLEDYVRISFKKRQKRPELTE